MSAAPARPGLSATRRLQIILLLLIAWDVLALVAEISFGGALFKLNDAGEVTGVLATRGGFNGAAAVPLTLYVYALIRGPLRYRGLIWIGVLEQGVIALAAALHIILDHATPEGAALPLAVSLALVVLLLVNMPRGQVPA
jgi:hypothetical protein